MNRLQYVDASLKSQHPNRQFSSTTHADSKLSSRFATAPHFQNFIPLHYEKNYAYPLLVWLHGPTGSEMEITQVMPHISVRNYLGVSPRGTLRHPVRHPNGDPTFTWDQSPQSIESATEDVLQCIEQLMQRFNIAANRVFLAGTDVGGTMALRLALNMPERFAGVASFGGPMPRSSRPLAGYHNARSMPVLLIHGRDSEQYDADQLCGDIRLLHSAGMQVNVRQYPCGHEVTTKMLSDLNVWIMERVAGVSSESQVISDPARLRTHDHN